MSPTYNVPSGARAVPFPLPVSWCPLAASGSFLGAGWRRICFFLSVVPASLGSGPGPLGLSSLCSLSWSPASASGWGTCSLQDTFSQICVLHANPGSLLGSLALASHSFPTPPWITDRPAWGCPVWGREQGKKGRKAGFRTGPWEEGGNTSQCHLPKHLGLRTPLHLKEND